MSLRPTKRSVVVGTSGVTTGWVVNGGRLERTSSVNSEANSVNRCASSSSTTVLRARLPVVGDYVLPLAGMRVTPAPQHTFFSSLGPEERSAVEVGLTADVGTGGGMRGGGGGGGGEGGWCIDLSLTFILEEEASEKKSLSTGNPAPTSTQVIV